MKPFCVSGTGGWVFAIVCSLLFHILGLFLVFGCSRGCSSEPAQASGQNQAAAKVEDTTPPDAPVETVAEEPGTKPAAPADVKPSASAAKGKTDAKPSAPTAKGTAKPAAEGRLRSYTVRSGDNLTHLARNCGLTTAELAALNGTDVKKLANLKVGQVIKLPAASAPAANE